MATLKCCVCGKEFVRYDSIRRTCSSACQGKYKCSKIQNKKDLSKRRASEIAKLPKNSVRYVTDKTKEEVLVRDGGKCVCCGKAFNLERVPHHAFYGSEANLTKTRNDADQLVTICTVCHHALHFESGGHLLRLKCKEYLYSLYGLEAYGKNSQPPFLRSGGV